MDSQQEPCNSLCQRRDRSDQLRKAKEGQCEFIENLVFSFQRKVLRIIQNEWKV